jgi:acylphosphatase
MAEQRGGADKSAIFARVEGRVQGVGFRYTCQEAAARLGLTGWVRNTDDGSVEVWAEGSDEQLAAFRQWLGKGPSRARVDSLDIFDISSPQNARAYTGFSIKF